MGAAGKADVQDALPRCHLTAIMMACDNIESIYRAKDKAKGGAEKKKRKLEIWPTTAIPVVGDNNRR